MILIIATRPYTSLVCTFAFQRRQQTTAVYLVNGASLTHAQCAQVAPEQRTVAHWQVLLDWERQRTQPYVIVDPFDPSGLLYFSEVEYKIQARTLGSMNTPFIVVARPGSQRPVSKISPDSFSPGTLFEDPDPITWREMKRLRSFIARNMKWTRDNVVRVNDRNIMGLVWLWSRELFHQLGENGWAKRQGQFIDFVRHFQTILRQNGSTYAIQRLKITLFALYSWLGGNPLKSTNELGQRIRLRNGLPKWLPRQALRRSKKTGLRAIRLWASMLNIYKYIHGEHDTPPLETIMAPKFSGTLEFFYKYCEDPDGLRRSLRPVLGTLPKFVYKSAKGLVLTTAGANHPVSFMSAPSDSYAWDSVPINWVKKWFTYWGDDEMLELMEDIKSKYDPKCRVMGGCEFCLCKPRLGRLHPIEEAAGKVRVVAICDYFTQAALKPVHDYLFEILRALPTDATFDQQAAVDRFASLGHKEIYSFDLKAATDLIPLDLYWLVMREFIGEKGSFLWKMILSDRDFFAEPGDFDLPARDELAPNGFLVRYTRGQPMGALSSWGALALLHHTLVQYSAYRLHAERGVWFTDYLVLGDDIVIADKLVADYYLKTCEELGITVGLPKSLMSEDGLMNFASQTVYQGANVSPISLKEEISAQNIPMRVALVERVLSRWGGDRSGERYLKRLLTEPQWSAVSDGGIRGSGRRNLDLVRFLVENPFRKEGLTTGSVLSWLGLVYPELRKVPSGVVLDFDRALKACCLQDTMRKLLSRLNEASHFKVRLRSFLYERDRVVNTICLPPIHPEDVSPVPERVPESIDDVYRYLGGEPALRLERLFGQSNPAFCEYILESLETRINDVVVSKLKLLRNRAGIYMYRNFVLENGDFDYPDDGPSLHQVVDWHNSLMDVPKLFPPEGTDREMLLASLFKKLPENVLNPALKRKKKPIPWTLVKESIEGPIGSVAKALAKVFGISLPIDLILNRAPTSIYKMLRRLRSETIAAWIARDASPCLGEERSLVPYVILEQERAEYTHRAEYHEDGSHSWYNAGTGDYDAYRTFIRMNLDEVIKAAAEDFAAGVPVDAPIPIERVREKLFKIWNFKYDG